MLPFSLASLVHGNLALEMPSGAKDESLGFLPVASYSIFYIFSVVGIEPRASH